MLTYGRRVDNAANHFLLSRIPELLDSYCPHTQETSNHSLNALLPEFDKVAETGREAFVHLVNLSNRVARTDVQLFSERGKFIDTLKPLYDAYLILVKAATEAHAACGEYLFLLRKLCRLGPRFIPPQQIDEVLVAFSRCLQQTSSAAAEIQIRWKVTTAALRIVLNSYCAHLSLVSIIKWVDSRNAARVDLPDLLDALPETMRKSTEGLEKLLAAYAKLEDALNRVENTRRGASEPFGLQSDFGIALDRLIRLDTAVIHYRAYFLIANRWTIDRRSETLTISFTPLRLLIWKAEKDFLLEYCGTEDPAWLWHYEYGIVTIHDK